MMLTPELDALWANRHHEDDLATFERELDHTIAASGGEPWALWRLARLRHFRAMQNRESGEKLHTEVLFFQGEARAQRALLTDPNNVGALFWAACCGLEGAQTRSAFAAMIKLPTSRRCLEKAAELDSAFHYAGPLRVLGRIRHHAPRWLGGDLDEAVLMYERALKLAPGHPTTMLYLAETFLSQGRREEAREVLEEIVAAPPFADWIWEQERDRGRARLLLEGLGVQ